ncbi:MAG: hypothetical protein FWC70_07275 [Defluviitaleaceae bacterium]|nr:hypothetical protein [Defluviitaleaceae bacterium]
MLEFAFYFPGLFLTFLVFIISGLIITQRAVLDRSVALATTEAAAWLSSDMLPVEQINPFTNQPFQIRTNPYADLRRLYGQGVYLPLTQDAFNNRVEQLVRENARWSILGGWASDDIQVHVDPLRNYFFAVDLTVTATQQIRFPFVSRFTDFEIQSTSTARVFRPYRLLNDVHFIVDAARIAGFDVGRTRDFMDSVLGWLRSQ